MPPNFRADLDIEMPEPAVDPVAVTAPVVDMTDASTSEMFDPELPVDEIVPEIVAVDCDMLIPVADPLNVRPVATIVEPVVIERAVTGLLAAVTVEPHLTVEFPAMVIPEPVVEVDAVIVLTTERVELFWTIMLVPLFVLAANVVNTRMYESSRRMPMLPVELLAIILFPQLMIDLSAKSMLMPAFGTAPEVTVA